MPGSGQSELSRRVRSRIDAIYDAGAAVDASGERVPLYDHGVSRAQGERLRELAISEGARQTLEVGLAMGLSCLFLAEAVVAAAAEGGRHTAIDPAQPAWRGIGLRTIADAGLEQVVEVMQAESQLALPRLLAEGRSFDLAFIDGDHRFDPVFLDLYYCVRLVRPGGLVVLDDVWLEPVRLAAAYFTSNLGLVAVEGPRLAGGRIGRRQQRAQPGDLCVLRTPSEPPERAWDHFVAFG